VQQLLERVTPQQVQRALERPGVLRAERHAVVLLSPAARELLEPMARRARSLTLQRFGRTITLYAPLYLSSHCVNHCRYCGFAATRAVERRSLSVTQALEEARCLLDRGLRHLLLVCGEDPARYGVEQVAEVAAALRRAGAASVAVEIFPCDPAGYRRLAAAGVDGLVLYQETYQPGVYAELHPAGPKRDFARRLAAMEAGGAAGLRSLGIGALLGLAPHRVDGVYLLLHAAHLTRRFPGARLALSFPRLRPVPGGFAPVEHRVSDAELVQLILAARLLLPDAELVLSTREPAALRDRLLPLGITRISAGSRTTVGGYARPGDDAQRQGQFPPEDRRSVAEVAEQVRAAGFDVVTKDFDAALVKGEP
jgi:2-iminoacetate synthase